MTFPQRTLRVGIIGCGQRAVAYLKNRPPMEGESLNVAAIYDPDPHWARQCLNGWDAAEGAPFVADFASVLDAPDLDAVIIGSPNHSHAEIAIRAFEKRCPILLEKPVAINIEECRRLWRAWQDNGCPPVTVGFVLRYTPFLAMTQDLLSSPGMGDLLAVDSDESVGLATTALFWRGWRSRNATSGGFLVEKCSHDFDMLRALAGSEAARVCAFERRTHFHAGTPADRRHPRFDAALRERLTLRFSDNARTTAAKEMDATPFYEVANDVSDHQAVMIAWENDLLTNFTVCIGQPRTTRRLRVYGSNFSLEGDMERSRILLDRVSEATGESETEEFVVQDDQGGHHGGDRIIGQSFWAQARGDEKAQPIAGLRDGIEAVLIALAAQESAATGRPVDVRPMRQWVFESEK